jgi:hypothetical protein
LGVFFGTDWSSDQEVEKNASAFFEFRFVEKLSL